MKAGVGGPRPGTLAPGEPTWLWDLANVGPTGTPRGGEGCGSGFSGRENDSCVYPGVEEEPTVVAKTYVSVSKSQPAKAAGQGLPETIEILDGHFHLDRLFGRGHSV
ncbi:hypothetical protein PoB_005168700 [Plakobranchus ocellatus]|uniref:Uncharacterized protein n=1 Tax=Plakobranchus ocellatus TaxID=259542 RepID=A0AAV4C0R2_9GAST|nr:hypothetical protein PoB_005168700 [Plakobranchus ocellatus]